MLSGNHVRLELILESKWEMEVALRNAALKRNVVILP